MENQKPQVRNIKVDWVNTLNSGQDRFFLPTITVNQGDTIAITFVSNDTDAHTFTLESPYDFQINATVPGTRDYLKNEAPFTTNATNNSPGVKVFGTPGNVTGTGSFVAKYSGIFEYFCIYHVALGMFGYLTSAAERGLLNIVLNNSTATSGTVSPISIASGAASNTNSTGFTPSVITVVIGVNNTIQWTNNDSVPHTVTADDGSFSSGNMNPSDEFTLDFHYPWQLHIPLQLPPVDESDCHSKVGMTVLWYSELGNIWISSYVQSQLIPIPQEQPRTICHFRNDLLTGILENVEPRYIRGSHL